MVIGTASAYALIHIDNTLLHDDLTSQNTEVGPKKKCTLFHIHTEECGGKYVADRTRVYPGMNKRLRHHILKGNHKWHRDVCTKCHLTKKEVRKMEVEVRKLESEITKNITKEYRQEMQDTKLMLLDMMPESKDIRHID